MKQYILLAIFCMIIVGSVSAYGFNLSCPDKVQVGQSLKCSVDSNFPAGTTMDIRFVESQYTTTNILRRTITIQDNHETQYLSFGTKGLRGGIYKVETQFRGDDESKLSSDSVSLQIINLIDRSGEITITSPLVQNQNEALRIEGSIKKLGNDGVEIEVRGPDGTRVFGPQWIGTTNDVKNGAGVFTQKVSVIESGDYEVDFTDATSFIGLVPFHVITPAQTSIATPSFTTQKTTVTTKVPTTTSPTPTPTPTKSPLSLAAVIGALSVGGLFVVVNLKRKN